MAVRYDVRGFIRLIGVDNGDPAPERIAVIDPAKGDYQTGPIAVTQSFGAIQQYTEFYADRTPTQRQFSSAFSDNFA